MEELIANNKQVNEVASVAVDSLNAAGLYEILCAVTLPLLALLVGIRLRRWAEARPSETLHAHLVEYISPLFAPLLAVLFTIAARIVFHAQDITVHVLPFIIKLAIAWLAVQIVGRMSSRQSAGWVIALIIIPVTLLHLFRLWDPVTDALTAAEFTFGSVTINAFGVLKSIAALVGLFWLAGVVVKGTDSRLRRMRGMHVSNRTLIMKFFQVILYFIVFLIGMQVMGVSLTALSVFGGALGVGIGFGLQKIASNFISGIILLFEKSVQVDDLIELADGTMGYIRQNAARYTLLELFDGREVFIPNEEFINARVISLTHSNKRGRAQVVVQVAYGTDVEKARALILKAARDCPAVIADPEPACYLTAFGDSGLDLTLYFWVENVMDGRLGPTHDVMVNILGEFDAAGISIPFPHQVQVADPAFEERFRRIEKMLAQPAGPTRAKEKNS